jgi:selenide,water dikinase
VLVGAGHAHIEVLRRFGLQTVPGVRLTLVTKGACTPYSGMLPGYVAGHYTGDEIHIPVAPLAGFANCRLVTAEAVGLEPVDRHVHLQDGGTIAGDVISIDTGATTNLSSASQFEPYVIPVKPIDRFAENWAHFAKRIRTNPGLQITVVGAGAAGVELALSIRHRLRRDLSAGGKSIGGRVVLLEKGDQILRGFSDGVRRRLSAILLRHNIEVRTNVGKLGFQAEADAGIQFDLGQFDATFWTTGVCPTDWLKKSGLAVDEDGFIAVNSQLQSISHPGVFAAGDAAGMIASPRPKAGVIAVRQGPILAENLRRAVTGDPLRSFVPQKSWLSLISTGDRYAVASYGNWAAEGRWVWYWKNWIDRRFVRRFMFEASETKRFPVNSE